MLTRIDVVAKNIADNRLIVSTKLQQDMGHNNLINLEQTNWLGNPPLPNKSYTCRFRYRQPLVNCLLEQKDNQ